MNESYPEPPHTIEITELPDIKNVREREAAAQVSQQPWASYDGLKNLSSLDKPPIDEVQKRWNALGPDATPVPAQTKTPK